MPVHLSKHNLTYVSVPKVACSSLKQFFFRLENGFRFRPFKLNGRNYIIHTLAPCTEFTKIEPRHLTGQAKIAVVRNPASRIISCYTNKVRDEKRLHNIVFTPEQKKLGLVADPSLDNFIDLLPEYAAASRPIRHHSRPLSYFLGTDPAIYDRLFAMSQLPELVEYVAQKVGKVPNLPHRNRSTGEGVTIDKDELARNSRRIEEMFAEDIALYGDYM